MSSELLDTEAAAPLVGLSPKTLEKKRVVGGGPRYAKIGRAVRYRRSDLEAYVAARVIGSTSEPVAA